MPRSAPPRHARLFALLHQQELARAASARLAARPAIRPETVAPLARLCGQSLLRGRDGGHPTG
jgi:hypothetical protein